jgi:hypothetical protein
MFTQATMRLLRRHSVTKKTCRTLIMLTVVLSVSCGDSDPTVFGNDGATLSRLNLNGALALLSNSTGTITRDSKGMIFTGMKLYTLAKGGSVIELPVNFSGNPNGGTDQYVLYRLNERYCILSFFARSESYIIDQANGEVHKSRYLGQPGSCVAGAHDLYFNDIYALNTTGTRRHAKISNFLSADAKETELPPDVGSMILDEDDSLYSLGSGSPADIFYYSNGGKTKVASGVAVYNDHENKLNAVSADGKISLLRGGSVHTRITLPDVSLSGSLFQTYPFPEQQKTLAVLRNNISGFVMLYDVTHGAKKLNITTLDSHTFNFVAGSALDKNLFLLGVVADSAMVVRVDVTDYSYTQTFFKASEIELADNLTALSDTEMVARSCQPIPGSAGACQLHLVYFDMSGNVKTIFDGFDTDGEVIRLSDN